MGGYYSGRWHWYTKKTTVEECSVISVSDFSKEFLNHRYDETGIVYASETDGAKFARLVAERAVDRLLDRAGETKPVRSAQTGQQFKLTRTACNYGGYRYWLLCPICGRRCGKLYKPYEYGWRYACRQCHDLTYTSAQEAHQFDRSSIGDLARRFDILTRAELVHRKIEKARVGSKNFWRLVARYEQIVGKFQPFDT